MDLASLASVRSFAQEFLARKLPLHILINNAGIMACPLSRTEDGFENQFGTNPDCAGSMSCSTGE